MHGLFSNSHPSIGVPCQIVWYPGEKTTYLLVFDYQVTPEDIAGIRQFATGHAGVHGVDYQHYGNPNSVSVVCRNADDDFSILNWLHATFTPHRKYTALAEVRTAAIPMVAHFKFIGRTPCFGERTAIARMLVAHPEIADVTRNADTSLTIVYFRAARTVDDAETMAMLLTNHDASGVTIVLDHSPQP